MSLIFYFVLRHKICNETCSINKA
uniref:Uncharacterized protein n=1 Tax=Anguilla anguilla TaxID=7936 RepID=A0A0E9TK52_ANGAN